MKESGLPSVEIRRYTPEQGLEWDEFIRASRNGTFMLERGYVDYHTDTLSDHSIMVYDHKDRLVAVMPGNGEEPEYYSHQGLSYAGLIMGDRLTASTAWAALTSIRSYLRGQGFLRLWYKAVPRIYHRYPAEEDLYALHRLGAILHSREISTTIRLDAALPLHRRRRYALRHAGDLEYGQGGYREFWPVLEKNLQIHNTTPTHTVEEMELLTSRFPENIAIHTAQNEGVLVAGVVTYATPLVMHTQYIAANKKGRDLRALDFLFDRLMVTEAQAYFDFGISTEGEGKYLNVGLIEYKESYGGRATVNDTYRLDL